MKEGHENFDFVDDVNLEKYLGLDLKRHTDGRIKFTQTHLIQRFLDVIGMYMNQVNTRNTPVIKPLPFKDVEGLSRTINLSNIHNKTSLSYGSSSSGKMLY